MHSKTAQKILITGALWCTAVSPLAAKGIEVRTPAGADVSQHATYGWMPTPSRLPDHPLSLDSPQGQALRREIEAALQGKGYTYSAEPGFLLRLNGVVTDSYNFVGKSDKVAKGVVWEYQGSGAKQSAEGTLVLEALDASRRNSPLGGSRSHPPQRHPVARQDAQEGTGDPEENPEGVSQSVVLVRQRATRGRGA